MRTPSPFDLSKWAVAPTLARVRTWWLAEFLALFPDQISAWLTSSSGPSLLVNAEPDEVTLELRTQARSIATMRCDDDRLSSTTLDEFLKAKGKDRRQVEVRLVLPPDRFFERSFDIPAEARAKIAALHIAEIERRTPFRLGEILCDYRLETLEGSAKIRVFQTIIRRDFVQSELARVGLTLSDLRLVLTSGSSPQDKRSRVRIRAEADTRRWVDAALAALAGLAILLATLGAGLIYWGQEIELDRLEGEILRVQPVAQAARSRTEARAREQKIRFEVRNRKATNPNLADVLEEITRLLPDDSWLTEFRLSEDRPGEREIAVSGETPAATALVAVVDASALLADAALTAPITTDPTERRERFSLRARVGSWAPQSGSKKE